MSGQFDILFQPVQIGPVRAPNRFYQVPQCNGFGHRMPKALAAMRGIKAEGGWGVVCTEEVEIHHTSDLSPYVEGRIWGDADIPAWRRMTEAVHAHGALAGIELAHNGLNASNLYSRVPPLGPRSMATFGGSAVEPVQARRMDKQDIRDLRRWHRAAALRARAAGFDIIYCYAAHNMSIAMQFLLRRYNDRSDEYGGSLENRVRLLRELIEDTKEAVGDRCAVAVRLAVDELMGSDGLTSTGEGHDIVALLAELPDLWDVNISGWQHDSASSRFSKAGHQEPYIGFVKSLTSKPVVGVGRYTSPESMVSAIERGIVDLIGAARPSIADPFLPAKIKAGRIEDIRECIGCNICVTGDMLMVPIRCTQNPTMGEAWRRGWHPERIAPKKSEKGVLIVGGGPAGLECARALGARGYDVTLTEARREVGGRVVLESQLPGLAEWRRVVDWRVTQIAKMKNVSVFPGSLMSEADVLEAGFDHVVIATGAHWRRDGIGRELWQPLPGHRAGNVFTPDDIMAGRLPTGDVLIFDNEHYYFGGVIAQMLAENGCRVELVTTAPLVSAWTVNTLEQERIQSELLRLGVGLHTQSRLTAIKDGAAEVDHAGTGDHTTFACDAVVLITDRLPNDGLFQSLRPHFADATQTSLKVIGDAEAPNIIAQAVYAGYLAAVEFDEVPPAGTPFRLERNAA